MNERSYDPISIARQFRYVREAQSIGQNRGLRVEAIQHWAGGATADSWCAEFLWMVFDIAYQGNPPFDRVQACEDLHQLARKRSWIVTEPHRGDIVLTVNEAGHAHHVGIVTQTGPLKSIAGNTSVDGVSDNGDRVAEHAISPNGRVFVHLPPIVIRDRTL